MCIRPSTTNSLQISLFGRSQGLYGIYAYGKSLWGDMRLLCTAKRPSQKMSYPPLHPSSRSQPTSFSSAEEFGRIFSGETDYVEFKTGTGNQPLQDAIVAFSNADGGIIFVGVKNDATVVKRELTQGTLDTITQAFRDTRDPGRYSVRQIYVGDTPIVAVGVARRVNGFAQTSNGRILARRGSHKVALFGDELRRLLIDRSLERFDEHDSGVPLSAVADNRLREIRRLYGWSGHSGLHGRLCERGLLLAHNSNLTIAGAMYLLDDPSPMFGKAYIEILRYPSGAGEYDRRIASRFVPRRSASFPRGGCLSQLPRRTSATRNQRAISGSSVS